MGLFAFGFGDFVGVVGQRELLDVRGLGRGWGGGTDFVVRLFDFAGGRGGGDAELVV